MASTVARFCIPLTGRSPWQRPLLAAILMAAGGTGLGYNLSIPVAEAPDEPSHLQYVYFLRERRTLPFLSPPGGGGISQGAHPPLYYLLAAVLSSRLPNRPPPLIENPHFSYNLERGLIPNVYVHAHEPPFPYRGAPEVLAVHVMRLVSWAALLMLVAGCYRLAAAVWPDRPCVWCAVAAMAGGLPGVLFLAGVCNNELLAAAWASWALAGAVRLALGSVQRRALVGLGVALALAVLTKMSALPLVAVAALAALIHLWRWRDWAIAPRVALQVGAPVVALTAPWFWHNSRVYGLRDLAGWHAFVEAAPELGRRLPLRLELASYWQQQFASFWGSFGWNTVRLPTVVYGLFAALSLLALAGLLRLALSWRRLPLDARWALVLLLCAWLIGYASVFRLAFAFGLVVAQGRYLYPFLPAFAVLWTSGLAALLPARARSVGMACLAAGMLAVGVWSWLAVARPAFALPQPVPETELGADTVQTDVLFDGRLRLRGYQLRPEEPRAGEPLVVTLYWQAVPTTVQEPTRPRPVDIAFVHLLGEDGEVIARQDAMPLGGRLPTFAWPPGAVYREDYAITVAANAPAGPGTLLVGWYPDGQPDKRLSVSRNGEPIGDVLRIQPVPIRAAAPAAGARGR